MENDLVFVSHVLGRANKLIGFDSNVAKLVYEIVAILHPDQRRAIAIELSNALDAALNAYSKIEGRADLWDYELFHVLKDALRLHLGNAKQLADSRSKRLACALDEISKPINLGRMEFLSKAFLSLSRNNTMQTCEDT